MTAFWRYLGAKSAKHVPTMYGPVLQNNETAWMTATIFLPARCTTVNRVRTFLESVTQLLNFY